jgi:hypothetical protein
VDSKFSLLTKILLDHKKKRIHFIFFRKNPAHQKGLPFNYYPTAQLSHLALEHSYSTRDLEL